MRAPAISASALRGQQRTRFFYKELPCDIWH